MRKIIRYVLPPLLVFLCACAAAEAPARPTETSRYSKVINTGKFAARSDLEAPALHLPQGVRAVIVPHGGEALPLAAAVIAGLAESNPRAVLLLGPNHTADGPKIATTYAAFSAYDGMVLPREDLIRPLEDRGLVGIDDALFKDEHSVGILMPLLARYLPGAKAVPLIFQKGASFNTAKKAVDALCALADPDTVIVASIDFSHGLPAHEEETRRAQVLDYIRVFDWAGVLELDGTWVDAPVVLAALLRLMQENGCHMEVLAGANTAELLGRDVPAATGYMTIVFYEGN